MVTTAIIAEFNPLHKGHKYIINEARRITGADCIIIAMSGSFTQRGDIAVAPKYLRTQAALMCGADIVIELPFAYATSCAEAFALGAVSLLNSLGFVDYLVFGSECGDIDVLCKAASLLSDETPQFKAALKEAGRSGLSYPAALEAAYKKSHCSGAAASDMAADTTSADCSDATTSDTAAIIASSNNSIIATGSIQTFNKNNAPDFTPNNILAIEYIKAIAATGSHIKPLTVKRQGAAFISALGFRKELFRRYSCNADIAELSAYMYDTLPEPSAQLFCDAAGKTFPLFNDDMLSLIRYALIINRDNLARFADFTPALANRTCNQIKSNINLFENGCEAFILQLKTKNITAARIQRALIHLLCGYDCDDSICDLKTAQSGTLPYIRLLGVGNIGMSALKDKKKTIDTPIVNRLSKSISLLDDSGKRLLSYDIKAADIYAAIIYAKFGYAVKDEFRQDIATLF